METCKMQPLKKTNCPSRKVLPTSPPQVEYKMTKKGNALRSIVEEMKKWEQTYGD